MLMGLWFNKRDGFRYYGTLAGSPGQDIEPFTTPFHQRGNVIRFRPDVGRLSKERLAETPPSNLVETDPGSDDPRLIGRTYAIPFEAVWRSCMKLVQARSRWRILESDDLVGFIRVRCVRWIFGQEDDLEILVGLDEHGLTRVDFRSSSRTRRRDLGVNARRVGRFSKRLDKALGAGQGKILDPRETARLTRRV